MPTTTPIKFDGEKLRLLREQRLWTRHELGKRAGMHPDNVGRIERGDTKKPQMGTIRKLVEALDIDPSELFGKD